MIGLLGGNWGYTDAEGNKVPARRDMTDGGGAGRYGDTFEGGPISGLLNDVGVRPHGYRARQNRMAEIRANAPAPQTRPEPVLTYGPQNGRGGRRADVALVGMNPVTPYGEAARFGLLAPPAPEPNMAYSGRGYVGMPIDPALLYDENNTRIHEYLRSVGALNY